MDRMSICIWLWSRFRIGSNEREMLDGDESRSMLLSNSGIRDVGRREDILRHT